MRQFEAWRWKKCWQKSYRVIVYKSTEKLSEPSGQPENRIRYFEKNIDKENFLEYTNKSHQMVTENSKKWTLKTKQQNIQTI